MGQILPDFCTIRFEKKQGHEKFFLFCEQVVEMSDKAVMTTQLPEQWSLMSSGSDSRRISLGATSPPGSSPPPAPTLSGGVPDLLPTCVVRHAEYGGGGSGNNPW